MATVDETTKLIATYRKELADILKSPNTDLDLARERVKTWTNRVIKQLTLWGLVESATRLKNVYSYAIYLDASTNLYKEIGAKDAVLQALHDDMILHPESYVNNPIPVPAIHEAMGSTSSKNHRIFLGHGGNKIWARVHMHLKDDLRLDVEAWESTPRAGHHSVDVLKKMLSSCTFAVIVATGEDSTNQGNLRARQNVVHEIGLFQGHIGFEKVALLRQDGIEEFSNLAGLQVIPFPADRIEAAFYELDRMLKRESIF